MDSLFGVEITGAVRFIIAFVVVLALIAVTAWLVRRISSTRAAISSSRSYFSSRNRTYCLKLPGKLAVAGLSDDQIAALDGAWELVKHWSAEDRQGLRDAVPRLGLNAQVAGRRAGPLRALALAAACHRTAGGRVGPVVRLAAVRPARADRA